MSGSANQLELHEKFMTEALSEAEKGRQLEEVPVGAVIVHENQIIARAHNTKEAQNLATRHAEIEAIEMASKTLGRWRLSGCTLYVTLEPCVMCSGAVVQARLDQVVFGTEDPKGGGLVSLYQIGQDERLNHKVDVVSDVLKEPCSQILKDFFKARR